MWGPNFPSYHALLDDHASELLAMTDALAERVRKLGGSTLRSIGHIGRLQRVADNDADLVQPSGMMTELYDDHHRLADWLRAVHALCDEHGDCGQREPHRELARRDRASHLVPVRDAPVRG